MTATMVAFAGVVCAAAGTKVLHHFDDSASRQGWRAVNDGVMGGLSTGGPSQGDKSLRFSGALSLENNGGFSSIRKQERHDLSAFAGVRLKVRGDGRNYQLRVQTDARYRGWPVSYSGTISTRPDEWIEVDVPFNSLQQSFRGRRLSRYPFDAGRIEMLGLMVADKRSGPFAIEVAWIHAYRRGDVVPK